MRRFAAAVALAAAAGCVVVTPGPQGEIVIEIPDTVVRGEPGTVHVVAAARVAPDDVGRECVVTAQGTNNESLHPNSDLLVRSGAHEVVVPDVESLPNFRTFATSTLTIGAEITVAVRLGPDEVFSGGLVVLLDCDVTPEGRTFTGVSICTPETPFAVEGHASGFPANQDFRIHVAFSTGGTAGTRFTTDANGEATVGAALETQPFTALVIIFSDPNGNDFPDPGDALLLAGTAIVDQPCDGGTFIPV